MPLSPPDDLVRRFSASLLPLIGGEADGSAAVVVAVSGGPDSMALLLLAAAALPGRTLAATVDHRLRPGSEADAEVVADLCVRLGVPHATLALDWEAPSANLQARARAARYARLGDWALAAGARFVATAHHLDDQAETLLMRLGRGAGVGGLAGVRELRPLTGDGERTVDLIRPLLHWRRDELRRLVEQCGAAFVDDPSNVDPAHDRTRARAFLDASPDWPDRARMAASARHLGEADQALAWAAAQLVASRGQVTGGAHVLDVAGVPPELRRRLVNHIVETMSPGRPEAQRGDVLTHAVEQLGRGQVVTLAGIVVRPSGSCWRFEQAPPRRS